MPCVIICKTADGRVLVNSSAEDPQQYLQGAVEASSVDEAVQMAAQVLGDDPGASGQPSDAGGQGAAQGDQPQPGDGDDGPADQAYGSASPTDPTAPTDQREQDMEVGFKRAKKGY